MIVQVVVWSISVRTFRILSCLAANLKMLEIFLVEHLIGWVEVVHILNGGMRHQVPVVDHSVYLRDYFVHVVSQISVADPWTPKYIQIFYLLAVLSPHINCYFRGLVPVI